GTFEPSSRGRADPTIRSLLPATTSSGRQSAPTGPLAPRVHVSKLVARVLERADCPMRAREIHAAAQVLAGQPLRWASVRQALSAGVREGSPRFERVRQGVYRWLR